MSVCDKTCKPCIYSSVMSTWGVSCNYILVTGNRRGCPAGKGCERRIVGKKQNSIDGLIFRGRAEKKEDKKAEKAAYLHEWYLKHKEEYRQKSAEQYARRKAQSEPKKLGRPKGEDKTWSERKKATAERARKICEGRQREAIEDYLAETGLSVAKLAALVGVTESTMRKWKNEYNMADWTKLAQVGIRRPEGL